MKVKEQFIKWRGDEDYPMPVTESATDPFKTFGPRRIAFVDMDHTMTDAAWRDHMIKVNMTDQDWANYHSCCDLDSPVPAVVDLVNSLHADGWAVVIITGRNEFVRGLTKVWLEQHDVNYHVLIMRPDNDHRQAFEYKLDRAQEIIQNGEGKASAIIIDDNAKVCEAFKAWGIPALQVKVDWEAHRRSNPL